MSEALPGRAGAGFVLEPDHPRLTQRPPSPAERRARWEVRAAQWRAREVAEAVFGGVGATTLLGVRAEGAYRGLLSMQVPFDDLERHRARERVFLAAVARDPVLSRIPLVFVLGPDPA